MLSYTRTIVWLRLAAGLVPVAGDAGGAPEGTNLADYNTIHPWVVPREYIAERSAKRPGINFDEAKVRSYTLPPILTLDDGTPVADVQTWERRRRPELLALARREMYGVAPPRPDDLAFSVVEIEAAAWNGLGTRRRVAIAFSAAGAPYRFHVLLFVPNRRAGPVPVFLLLDHRGTAVGDTAAQNASGYWPVEYALRRGYAMAAIATSEEVEPDRPQATTGVRAHYARHHPEASSFTWGAISAWAWSAMRALDYLETDAAVDATKVAVIGHSRSGKAALWAGAQDTRFALVCPNGSGRGGTKLSARNLGEALWVNRGYPHWFTSRYHTYWEREYELPLDQHQIIALVAPRGFHDGEGSMDLWADPRGAWLALVAASQAWALHGRASILPETQPLVNQVVHDGPIAWHMHAGGHFLGLIDWKHYIDHADRLFGR